MADCFLQPGELFTAQGPARVKTVVGSCLAIMVRVPRLGLTAIAHCILPRAGARLDAISREEALRYVDTTMDLILRSFARRGVATADLEIKLFGGADGLGLPDSGGAYRVGARNIESVQALLAARGLTVAASGLGGRRGRAIEFDTGTGDVFIRKLPAPAAWERP